MTRSSTHPRAEVTDRLVHRMPRQLGVDQWIGAPGRFAEPLTMGVPAPVISSSASRCRAAIATAQRVERPMVPVRTSESMADADITEPHRMGGATTATGCGRCPRRR